MAIICVIAFASAALSLLVTRHRSKEQEQHRATLKILLPLQPSTLACEMRATHNLTYIQTCIYAIIITNERLEKMMATATEHKEYTVGLSEAKANLGKITAEVNRTGNPVTVFKNNKPWVVIYPIHATNVIQNPVTRAAMDEAERIFEDPKHVYFTDVMDMLDNLDRKCTDA
jgi:prevent-host-death family protein